MQAAAAGATLGDFSWRKALAQTYQEPWPWSTVIQHPVLYGPQETINPNDSDHLVACKQQ